MEFNTENIKRIPINRNNLFFSPESASFEEQVALDYITQDVNQTVVLFEVDLEKSNLNQTYYESKDNNIVFKTPVELPVLYKIEQPELKAYDKNKNLGNYVKTGKLSFTVFLSILKELDCDIKIGDYVGVQVTETHMEMFVVVNDGRSNYDNKHTLYGTKPYYRTIDCAPVDENEFSGE